jgi:hypothetical protein
VAVGDPVLVTLCSVFPSLCVPSVSAGNLAASSGRESNLGKFGVNLGGFALHQAKQTDISDTLVLCSGPLAAVGQGGCVHIDCLV